MSDDNVIFEYGVDQAIEDGVLIHLYPDRFPYLLLTSAVHAAIEKKIEGTQRTLEQAVIPLMMDAALAFRKVLKKDPNETLMTNNSLNGNVTGQRLWVAMNEKGGLTIMFPEDY